MVTEEHVKLLTSAAIDPAVYEGRVCSTDVGLEFDWHSPTGRVITQARPDEPVGGAKYMWPAGVQLVVSVPQGMQERVTDPAIPLVIVEGTKQHLAAASVALRMGPKNPAQWAVTGISGCWGWMQDDQPLPDWLDIPLEGRTVAVAFDADMVSNRNVWEAASRFSEFLLMEVGAKEVWFVKLPGSKDGMDDILGRAKDPVRTFERIMAGAEAKLPRRPGRSRARTLFDQDGNLLAITAFNELQALHPMAATQENSIAVYQSGVYLNGSSKQFNASTVKLLGEDFRATHMATITELTISMLAASGIVIPTRGDRLLINCLNGLLDPVTLELHPHDPDFLSLIQYQVQWDPQATCPTFDSWIESVLPGRRDEILDATCPVLDVTRTPSKSVFMYGPSRSGKSTFGRLIKMLVGPSNTSSVTLHQLADDRFASANMYGKKLNMAMDLSGRDVTDLSTFKMLTGDDPILGNRKWGSQFSFTNQALIMFSANEIPSVSETSKAWTTRVAPFKFPFSFAGAEDPAIEAAMLEELPGIFRRLVIALGEQVRRGGYLNVEHKDTDEFRRRSNRVEEFLSECTVTTAPPDGTRRLQVYLNYKNWVEQNGVKPLGRNRFYDALRALDVWECHDDDRNRLFALRLVDRERTSGSSAVFPHSPYTDDSVRNHKSIPVGESTEKVPKGSITAGTLVFDLETAGAEHLHDGSDGFVRLTATTVVTTPEAVIEHPGPIVAHNGFSFDFLALATRHGLDMIRAGDEGLLIDTMILGILDHPPVRKSLTEDMRRVLRNYSLDAMAARYGTAPKSDSITRLAKEFGGFDRIPVENEEYRSYCLADVASTREILEALPPMDNYATREMRLMARLAWPISGIGFRADVDLLRAREGDRQDHLRELTETLISTYEIPTLKSDGTPATSVTATKAGKDALDRAFQNLGVDLPRTTGGGPSLSGVTMDAILAQGDQAQRDLAQVVKSLNGERSIYATLLKHLHGERVHPAVHPIQSSGRFSIWDPGLTVMGKRGGRVVERAVMLPDEGHVLIAADLSQIDARAIAVHCQDPAYMALFAPGMDSHAEIARRVWGDPSRREAAKAIGHGWNYGMGLPRLARETGLGMDVAVEFDTTMRQQFPQLVMWRDLVREQALTGALDNGFGRRMRAHPDRVHTQAPALMGQGTARDLMMEGILRMPAEMAPMLRAIVHDEAILSVPTDVVEDVERQLLEALQFEWAPPGAETPIQVTAGLAERGSSWADCYR